MAACILNVSVFYVEISLARCDVYLPIDCFGFQGNSESSKASFLCTFLKSVSKLIFCPLVKLVFAVHTDISVCNGFWNRVSGQFYEVIYATYIKIVTQDIYRFTFLHIMLY